MPNADAVRCWILHHPEFRHSYAFARQFQAHCIADETIELADEMSTEWIEKVRANGRVVRAPDRKNLPRSRLRIGVRQWVAHRLLRALASCAPASYVPMPKTTARPGHNGS